MRDRALLGLLLLAPVPAVANMVWPALYLELRLFTWWAVCLGVVVEFLFVRWLFELPPVRSVVAVVVANAVSALAGVPLIPLAGFIWEFFPGWLYMPLFGWGTFNPITWGAAFFLACFINAAIESLVFKHGFKQVIRRRQFLWVVAANSLSVGAAFISLAISPIEP